MVTLPQINKAKEQVHLSLPIKFLPEQTGFCSAVATQLGINEQVVTAVVGGISCSMRVASKTDLAKVVVSLSAELERCARTYCGCANTEDEVFEACSEFVLDRFGHFGVGEIAEAFSLGAAGEFSGVNMKTYYGQFTVVMLGEILRGYDKYRVQVVLAVRRREVLLLSAESEAQKAVNWNTAAWKAARRETLLSMQEIDTEYITAYDYDWLTADGELVVTEAEKRVAWDQSRELVLADYVALALSNRSFRRAYEDVVSGRDNEGFKARRTSVAKRLLVVGWIERTQQLSV